MIMNEYHSIHKEIRCPPNNVIHKFINILPKYTDLDLLQFYMMEFCII